MNDKKKDHNTAKKIGVYLYVVLVLMSLFTVASYTWFSLSQAPEVSDMALYVNSPHGMELSADPLAEEWVLQLSFSELLGSEGVLKPATWSEQDQRFYAIQYGIDGRMSDEMEPLTDARNANKNNADGYYIVGTFYARSEEKVNVSLSPAVEVEEGLQGSGTFVIGTPVWNYQTITHDNGGSGAEYAIRVGFRIQKTDLEGVDTDEPAVFYIYEPNSDGHVSGETGYVDTASLDGTATLVPENRLIRQTVSTWQEVNPVQKNAVIRSLGTFETDTQLFELDTDELAKISIYVWLEGQDVDCTNQIGHRAQILASIQFAADPGAQSGLVPIE